MLRADLVALYSYMVTTIAENASSQRSIAEKHETETVTKRCTLFQGSFSIPDGLHEVIRCLARGHWLGGGSECAHAVGIASIVYRAKDCDVAAGW